MVKKSQKTPPQNFVDPITKGFIVLVSSLAAMMVIYTLVEAIMFPRPRIEKYPSILNAHEENYNSYEQRNGIEEGEDPGLTEKDRTRNKDN